MQYDQLHKWEQRNGIKWRGLWTKLVWKAYYSWHCPCKIGPGIPPSWPVFPAGSLLGKKNSRSVSQEESHREICTDRIPPRKNPPRGCRQESCQEAKSWWYSRRQLNSCREKNLAKKFLLRSGTFSWPKCKSQRGCVKPDLEILTLEASAALKQSWAISR